MNRRRRGWHIPLLAISDVLLINVAFVASYWLRYQRQVLSPILEANYVPLSAYVPVAVLLSGLLLVAYRLEGVYSKRRGAAWLDQVYAIFSGTLLGIALLTIVFFYYRPLVYSRLMFGYAGVLIVVLLSIARLAEQSILTRLYQRGIGVDRVLVVGAGEMGRAVIRNLLAQPELGYQVIGFVDDHPARRGSPIGRLPELGSCDDVGALLMQQCVDEVIITLPWECQEMILDVSRQCEQAGIRAKVVPDLFQLSLNRLSVETVGGIPLLGLKGPVIRGWNLAVKRGLDIAISALALVVLSPVLAIIAVLIKYDSPGPILFRQVRVGRGGELFTLYKFRSMRQGADKEKQALLALNEATGPLFKIRGDPRLTRVGRVLRRLSLDELPQFYNILRGDLSLVGPRPPVPSEVEQYQDWHLRRLDVSPGLTGLWQVSGRRELPFDEMVMLDLFYAEHWSLFMDFKILLRTIPTVILGTGAY